jgi:queuine tRNA-ribosyltransferase
VTLHNLHFYLKLMRSARVAILEGRFAEFRKDFVSNYHPNATL